MNRLCEIRLVNWHAFQDQTVVVDGSTLVAGTNASGKTTILDAIQWAMIADQTRVRFNMKATDRGKRMLAGYVRWRTLEAFGGDESGKYNRGACTGYVALRFENSVTGASFVCGTGLYAGESDQIGDQVLFIVGECRSVHELPCVSEAGDQRLVTPLREFRAWLRERKAMIVPSGEAYRAQLAGFLGHIPADYFRAFVRAISTRPLGNLDDFIKDFILEEREVETQALLENVNNYQRYLREAQETKRRISALDTVGDEYTRLVRVKGELQKVQFRFLEAQHEVTATALKRLRNRIEELQEKRADLDGTISVLETQLQAKKDAHWDAYVRYQSSESATTLERLRKQKAAVEHTLADAREARERALRQREGMITIFKKMTSAYAAALRNEMGVYIGADPFSDSELMEKVEQFLQDEEPDGRRARSWSRAIDMLRTSYERAYERASGDRNRLAAEFADLENEAGALRTGRVTYPPNIAATFEMLNAKLHRPAQPLCELLEVADEDWRDAIEAELGGARFAALIDPSEYERAIALLEQHQHGWRYHGQPVPLHGVRVIDIAGVQRDRRRAQPSSLATKILTNDSEARAYVDFLVGDVICVAHRNDLRSHRRAITATVLTHKAHGTQTSDPRHYRRHYIGAASQQRRLAEIDMEISALRRRIERLDDLLRFAADATAMAAEAAPAVSLFLADAETTLSIASLIEEVKGLREREELLRKDASLAAMERKVIELENAVEAVRSVISERREDVGRLKEALDTAAGKLEEEKAEAERAALELAIAREALSDPSLYEDYRRSYDADREGRDPGEIMRNAKPQVMNRESKVANTRTDLSNAMVRYNAAFGIDRPTRREDNNDELLFLPYREERERLIETTLADAEAAVQKAYDEARTQLAEDYLYRLYDSFLYVEERIRELNAGLQVREIEEWGTYRFTASPRSDMKRLFDLVMKVGQFGKDSLWSSAQDRSPDMTEEIDKLARTILSATSADAEQEIARLRDYRGFYSYDYIWEKKNGEMIHYAAVTGVGSGGENQLPYYIAMFAAMHQIYRQGARRSREPMCGLVLLDEAFSNMDDKNMAAAMLIASKLHLQLVVITPGDKTHTLIPHVGTTVVLIRDTSRTTARPTIRRFTREQAEEAIAALDGETAPALAAS